MLEDPIARRYFVMNFFDGVMTAFGIVVGSAFIASDPLVPFKASLGASLAIMVSGFFGAYMTERAERKKEIHEMEKLLLRNLKGSRIERDAEKKMIELAVIDGVSPFIGAIIPALPFLLAHFRLLSLLSAAYLSVSITFLLLLALGAYLGNLTGENPVKQAVLFAGGGIVVGLIARLFERVV